LKNQQCNRYNPVIIAQAFASLDVLYSGRIGLGIGTGEAMNEVPAGFDWPSADIRLARTTESIQIISRLWSNSSRPKGEKYNKDHNGFVDFSGEYLSKKGKTLHSTYRKNTIIHGSSWRTSNQNCCKVY
jgi:coenzyme F420-dependent glucose-6-phosphate dehydrogenase